MLLPLYYNHENYCFKTKIYNISYQVIIILLVLLVPIYNLIIQYGTLVVWSVYVRNAWVWVRLIHVSFLISKYHYVQNLYAHCALYKIIRLTLWKKIVGIHHYKVQCIVVHIQSKVAKIVVWY